MSYAFINNEEIKFNVISISGKRVFHTCMRFSALRTHEETLQWANEAEENGLEHVNGILGKSVIFEAPGFANAFIGLWIRQEHVYEDVQQR